MYVGQLLKFYTQFSREYVWDEMPMDEGYCWLAVAIQNDGWSQFSGLKPDGKTYLESAVDKLMEQAREVWKLDGNKNKS